MPPTFDVYAWVDSPDPVDVLARFIDRYVDIDQPGDPRLDAFFRTFVFKRVLTLARRSSQVCNV